MSNTDDDVQAGQAVYTKSLLEWYDFLVLGFSNRFVWRCPSRRILDLYNSNVSLNHLDVGVGTGYFLDRSRFPSGKPRVTLLDLNPECLQFSAKRIARYQPMLVRGNVLEPLIINEAPFDSIGLNYVLHCLPGTIESKECVFQHLKQNLTSGGVMFGSTILSAGVERSRLAVDIMKKYNTHRTFCNLHDDLDGLMAGIKRHFSNVTVEVQGCVALFVARNQ